MTIALQILSNMLCGYFLKNRALRIYTIAAFLVFPALWIFEQFARAIFIAGFQNIWAFAITFNSLVKTMAFIQFIFTLIVFKKITRPED